MKIQSRPGTFVLCARLLQKSTFFSDEVHSHLNGYVNQQNYRYWFSEDPKEKHKTQLHSLKVTVWRAIHAQGIIGLYFFEDGRGRAVTVDSDRYVDMLNNFFEPDLQDFDGYNRDTYHTSNRLLFSEKLISWLGDLPWPPEART